MSVYLSSVDGWRVWAPARILAQPCKPILSPTGSEGCPKKPKRLGGGTRSSCSPLVQRPAVQFPTSAPLALSPPTQAFSTRGGGKEENVENWGGFHLIEFCRWLDLMARK